MQFQKQTLVRGLLAGVAATAAAFAMLPVSTAQAATVATVTSFCARVGIMPGDLQVNHRSLDEVYLELTGREIRR